MTTKKLTDGWYEMTATTGHKVGFRMHSRGKWQVYFRNPDGTECLPDEDANSRAHSVRIADAFINLAESLK